MKQKRNCIALAMAALVIASLACESITTEKLQEVVVPATTEGVTETGVEPVGEATDELLPTAIPSAPTAEPEPIAVIKYGFGQDGSSAGYAFIVENPNMSLAYENSQYQLAVFDESGAVVGTDSGYIDLLLPGQLLGIAGDLFMDEGVTISKIEVQLNVGDPEPAEPVPAFSFESETYYEDDYSAYVTGVINNPYDINLTDLSVSAIVYDEAGNIIGGGYTYMSFILANGAGGIKVPVTSAGEVASMELYPTRSRMSQFFSEEALPDDALEIVLVKHGFGQGDYSVGFGMLIENPNSGYAIENSQYQITIFAEEGTVLETTTGYISLLLPEQLLGVAEDLYLEEGMKIGYAEIQLLAGDYVESEIIPLFTDDNATYQPGTYSSQVTGFIVSPYTSDITDVMVCAIVYDENEEIIGTGYTYLGFVPANGKAAVEVPVTVAGTPFSVELFATVYSLSDFE